MKVSAASNAKRIGTFVLTSQGPNLIQLRYLSSVPREILEDNAPRIYLFTIDDEIVKIGGSAQQGGIRGTMTFYTASQQGSPGVPRFVIHHLIANALRAGQRVDLYLIVSPRVLATIYGLSGVREVEIASFKEMENFCKEEYFRAEKKYPIWNFQENHEPYPEDLARLHNEYHQRRLGQ